MTADSMVDLVSIVGNGGGAVAVIAVVVIFLKYLREQRAIDVKTLERIGDNCHAHSERLTGRFEHFAQQLSSDNHEIAQQCAAVISDNTRALSEVSQRLRDYEREEINN